MSNLTVEEIRRKAETYTQNLPELVLPPGPANQTSIADWIDHTLLKPEATPGQVEQLCRETLEFNFAAVCINPIYVNLCASLLRESSVKVCTVIGFPLGATPTRVKVAETRACLEMGAREIDMVLPVGLLRAGLLESVSEDIQAVCETAHAQNAILKVIFENALLDNTQKIQACLLCLDAGADFVKTSTGFGPGGATLADVELMRRVVGPEMGVKAAGGVRSLADARAFLSAGANRLGTSAGVKIMQEFLAGEPTR
jgi:deoxyribose-phosphate aldolase